MATQKAEPRPSRVRYHHGDLRRDLLRVAREEIARSGAGNVTLAALARLVGVTQAAPYRHFADRDALLEAVAAEGFEEFTLRLDEATAAHPAPEDHLPALALAYVGFGEANVELYRLMFASRLVPDAEPGSALERGADAAYDRLRRAVASLSPAAAVEHDAVLVWARLHGLVMLRADGLVDRRLSELVGSAGLVPRR